MISFIAGVFWAGGVIPAYRSARKNGINVFLSTFNAVTWPADVGWNLALKHCKEHKE